MGCFNDVFADYYFPNNCTMDNIFQEFLNHLKPLYISKYIYIHTGITFESIVTPRADVITSVASTAMLLCFTPPRVLCVGFSIRFPVFSCAPAFRANMYLPSVVDQTTEAETCMKLCSDIWVCVFSHLSNIFGPSITIFNCSVIKAQVSFSWGSL